MSSTAAASPLLQQLQQLRETVRRQPTDFVSWLMLADAAMGAGGLEEARQALGQAGSLRAEHPETLARLGRLEWMQRHYPQAVSLLGRAAALAPQHPGIALWLGHALEDDGQAESAAQAYACAHRLLPDEPYVAAQRLNWQRRLCDWNGVDALSRQVRHAVAQGRPGVEPFSFLSEDAGPAEQLACARLRAAPLAGSSSWPLAPRADGPLRLGFLSNGFGAHPTGLLTVSLFEQLRTLGSTSVHLFALNADDGSDIRRRLATATTLHSVSGTHHAQIAQRIADQRIDILFDLRGWGGGGAPEVLAMRPAPVLMNWLAYPGTSGAPWIDYVIGDHFALPESLAAHYSERVLRMPGAFQPSDDTRTIGEPPSRTECGLPDESVVFCCFNNSYKLNPRSFTRLLDVLRGVRGSVLWLLSGPGRADERLRAAASGAGIDPQRLVFMPKLPHAQYLSRYRHADLFLDTHPYNAHTTASDALWAGCPVLTTPGLAFASRVAGSLNHHLGMDELNVDDDATFVATAVALGRDRPRLAALRERLATQREHTSLFDMGRFAKDFSALLEGLAKQRGWRTA
ncbi:MAG TPA: UDP-N-acetylglucosamine-peptide N-acetylglucosaminyltransferase [Stenotrophomonas sp.]